MKPHDPDLLNRVLADLDLEEAVQVLSSDWPPDVGLDLVVAASLIFGYTKAMQDCVNLADLFKASGASAEAVHTALNKLPASVEELAKQVNDLRAERN